MVDVFLALRQVHNPAKDDPQTFEVDGLENPAVHTELIELFPLRLE